MNPNEEFEDCLTETNERERLHIRRCMITLCNSVTGPVGRSEPARGLKTSCDVE